MSEAGEGSAAVLVISEGRFEGTRYQLTGAETIIGRNPSTHITLLDEGISREHAIFERDEATGTYTLEDLQSTNGTKVNGKRVRSATLSHGDQIEIGHTKLQFLLSTD